MYNPKNITFSVTFSNNPALRPLINVLRFLGRGYKKRIMEQLILKLAVKVENDPKLISAICKGNFDIIKTK